MPPEEQVNITIEQKKMSFCSSADHIQAAIAILRECGGVPKLVGDSSHETVVNAVTLDAQQEMMKKFINAIDSIKQGSLHEPR